MKAIKKRNIIDCLLFDSNNLKEAEKFCVDNNFRLTKCEVLVHEGEEDYDDGNGISYYIGALDDYELVDGNYYIPNEDDDDISEYLPEDFKKQFNIL
jgi:hypothetical protein